MILSVASILRKFDDEFRAIETLAFVEPTFENSMVRSDSRQDDGFRTGIHSSDYQALLGLRDATVGLDMKRVRLDTTAERK
jgi:hypothetical protein